MLGHLSEDSGRVASTDARHCDFPLKGRPIARRTQNMKLGARLNSTLTVPDQLELGNFLCPRRICSRHNNVMVSWNSSNLCVGKFYFFNTRVAESKRMN